MCPKTLHCLNSREADESNSLVFWLWMQERKLILEQGSGFKALDLDLGSALAIRCGVSYKKKAAFLDTMCFLGCLVCFDWWRHNTCCTSNQLVSVYRQIIKVCPCQNPYQKNIVLSKGISLVYTKHCSSNTQKGNQSNDLNIVQKYSPKYSIKVRFRILKSLQIY